MALLGNYSVLSKSPGRHLSGSSVADDRAAWSKSGPRRNRYLTFNVRAAEPVGYLPPYTRTIPIKSGWLGSYNRVNGAGTLSGSAAMGVNLEATMAGTGTISDAACALIVSLSATLTGTGTITDAAITAPLQMAATLAGTGNLTGAITALGHAVATLNGTGTVTATPSAIGHMSAEITPFTALSPQTLASAVWSAIAADFADPGTTGEAIRIMRAVLANRVVTDPAAGTYTVYDDDNTTVLAAGDLWADAAGTTQYSGSGAERRDRLT